MKSRQLNQANALPSAEDQNDKLIQWVEDALCEYRRRTGADTEDIVSYLLADIMYWCDRHAQNFDTELQRGRELYEYIKNNDYWIP